MIGCESSEHSWHLSCEGNSWVGVVGNCSESGENDQSAYQQNKSLLAVTTRN